MSARIAASVTVRSGSLGGLVLPLLDNQRVRPEAEQRVEPPGLRGMSRRARESVPEADLLLEVAECPLTVEFPSWGSRAAGEDQNENAGEQATHGRTGCR